MTAQGRQVSILGVPTSAGSHNPGQEKAPAAWRAAGLIGELRAAGLDEKRLKVRIEEGATHNEAAWAARFPDALEFLYST